jgi:hypothetical protein
MGVKFGKIYGNFSVYSVSVYSEVALPEKNLSGFPIEVVKSFHLYDNGSIQSLKGLPKIIGGDVITIRETSVRDFSPLNDIDLNNNMILDTKSIQLNGANLSINNSQQITVNGVPIQTGGTLAQVLQTGNNATNQAINGLNTLGFTNDGIISYPGNQSRLQFDNGLGAQNLALQSDITTAINGVNLGSVLVNGNNANNSNINGINALNGNNWTIYPNGNAIFHNVTASNGDFAGINCYLANQLQVGNTTFKNATGNIITAQVGSNIEVLAYKSDVSNLSNNVDLDFVLNNGNTTSIDAKFQNAEFTNIDSTFISLKNPNNVDRLQAFDVTETDSNLYYSYDGILGNWNIQQQTPYWSISKTGTANYSIVNTNWITSPTFAISGIGTNFNQGEITQTNNYLNIGSNTVLIFGDRNTTPRIISLL